MPSIKPELVHLRRGLWSHPDPLLIAAGARGELLVAKIRLLLTAVLLLIPIMNILTASDARESLVGFGVTAIAFLLSLLAYLLIARDFHRPWLSFASSCFDVTLVSGALATFLLFNQPHTAVNSKVVFEGYFLAVGATCLRYDRRVCVVAGLLALSEYLAIVTFAATKFDLNNEVYSPFAYGMFSWNTQFSRMILMLTATLLSIAVVSRTQGLLRLSTSDPLTGLFNRGYFNERFGIEIGRAGRHNQPLTIAMIDVDHFKSFNDLHGHAAGDMVLQVIAETLRTSFRQSDIVGRYGGEEFVIAMPETDAETAGRKLESFRQLIASTPIRLPKTGESAFVTISAGLSGFPEDGIREEELLWAADSRLFKAKAAGRNQIVV